MHHAHKSADNREFGVLRKNSCRNRKEFHALGLSSYQSEKETQMFKVFWYPVAKNSTFFLNIFALDGKPTNAVI